MSDISAREAADLLEKLMRERLPVVCFMVTPLGIRADVRGFVEAATMEKGLFVASTDRAAYLNVPFKGRTWISAYGEQREFEKEMRFVMEGDVSILVLTFDNGDRMALYFAV